MASPQDLTRINQVLSPAIAGSLAFTATPTIKGLYRKKTVYIWPDEMDDEDKKSVLMTLTIPGRSTSKSSEEWQTWVMSWTCLVFEAFVGKLKAKNQPEYSLTPLPQDFIDEVKAADNALETDPDTTHLIHFPTGLPMLSGLYGADVYDCGDIKGVYGYYALITHLMGKRVDTSTRDAITTKRPDNLINSFGAKDVSYILKGNGRMGNTAHSEVPQAWKEVTLFRRIVIDEFAKLPRGEGTALEMVALMFRLLENSGMQTVAFIHHLLTVCPWVIVDVPSLKPAYDLYMASLEIYAREPPYLQPYTKLYWGDTTKIFHSKSLAGLTRCAITLLEKTNPSMAGYNMQGGDSERDQFITAALAHGIDLVGGQQLPGVTPSTTT
jgi:hypothetical protein